MVDIPPLNLTQVANPMTGDSLTTTGSFFAREATTAPKPSDLVGGAINNDNSLLFIGGAALLLLLLMRKR